MPDTPFHAPLPTIEGGFQTVLADPPWRFANRTGKVAPEHRRLGRYGTMGLDEIRALPVGDVTASNAHLYLWVPNALLPDGLAVMEAWGFRYVSNIIWAKRRKDGGPDGRGVGFYFRNVTEPILFGVKGSMRTLAPARSTVNMIETRKREHSRKPDEQYDLIEACSPGPYLELFARYAREGWSAWGNERGRRRRRAPGAGAQRVLGRRDHLTAGAEPQRAFEPLALEARRPCPGRGARPGDLDPGTGQPQRVLNLACALPPQEERTPRCGRGPRGVGAPG